ncbi:arabinosyltransferase domain-containing protein, partial [Saccharomonospora iraqiensis]|uniref:arabinosyltransferase domain-containing protein n=1 Tax=Saccharomonospora iraqiensis TaxID=52698 RepID=UPI00022E1CDE
TLPSSGCTVRLAADAGGTTVTVGGSPVYEAEGDVRPRVVGIYSDIDDTRDPVTGLGVSITPDTRYQSSATGLKTTVGVAGGLALVGCLVAVRRTDAVVGRRAPRWARRGRWRPTGRDLTVVGVLGAWVFIGPVTSDDGYILTMSRVAGDAGYLTNYHRWFGVAEAPFGWFYYVYDLMAQVSVVPPWIRLPSFLLGVLTWLLLSRAVLPRLGHAVRTSRAAGWAAATVFLVWWLPYNNGVRPEPVAAVGSLLALYAVERTLATRRLLPLCLGLSAAAFTFAATPTGLIAVAPFLVAAKPLLHLVRERARYGWSPVLVPIGAAGLVVLFVVFADQTYASVLEAVRLRNAVGPSLSWFEELERYELLFAESADGAATRRFPVLLLMLSTATCLAVLLRRDRIPGTALGPSRRLIGTVALFFVLLALTPTKWTHHFGAFAGVGAAMGALTAPATSSSVLRSKRNRAAFVAGLLLVAALSVTGPNAYWFVSRIGVPWHDIPPELAGIPASTLLVAAAAVAALVAFVENLRVRRPGPPREPERRSSALWRGSLALIVGCGLVIAAEFGSMVKGMWAQSDSYSLGAANLAHLTGTGCGLGRDVTVERDPVASVLSPVPGPRQHTVVPDDSRAAAGVPTGGGDPVQATAEGFHPAPDADGDPLAEPPHGLTPDTTPMWSSYGETGPPTGDLRTPWFGLDDADGDQLVVTVSAPAGKATSVDVQFGEQTPGGTRVVQTRRVLAPGGGTDEWHNVRIDLADVPEGAAAVRIAADDDDLTEDGWVAATAPRAPSFTTLADKVGDRPVYVDWPAAFVYPCVNPVKIRDGILDVPAYHLTAGDLADEAEWAAADAGGMLGTLEEVAAEPEVPSYLTGDPDQPWGTLHDVRPYETGREPTVLRGERVRTGWWSPGPGPVPSDGPAPDG